TSAAALRGYQDRIDAGAVRTEMYPVRGVHQAFGHGLVPGLVYSGLAIATGGRLPASAGEPGYERMQMLATRGTSAALPPGTVPPASNLTPVDRKLTFDKVTNVHYS